MKDHRGRPKENDVAPIKFELETIDYEGVKTIIKFDKDINKNGAISTEIFDEREADVPVLDPKTKYTQSNPVVLVFKTKRKNAVPKMKVWKNKNIDDILTTPQAGVPSNAKFLELGVGVSFIERWKLQYGI